MTKQEAIELESDVDKLFSEAVGKECNVSMALTGALKVGFDNGFINIKPETQIVDWVKWNGYYEELRYAINNIISVLRDDEEKIKLLMDSYKINLIR